MDKSNKIGFISKEDYIKRTISIAKGEYKPQSNEPKIWIEISNSNNKDSQKSTT